MPPTRSGTLHLRLPVRRRSLVRLGSRRRPSDVANVPVVERSSLARPTSSGWQHRPWASSDRTSASSVESLSSNPGTRTGGVLECRSIALVPDRGHVSSVEIKPATKGRNDPAREFCVRLDEWKGIFLSNKPDTNQLHRACSEEKCRLAHVTVAGSFRPLLAGFK